MIEDGITEAFKNFNSTLMGSVAVVTMIAAIFMFRFLNRIITETREELKAEREAHQRTRDSQIEDIRNLGHVARSVDGMRTSVEDLNTNMRDLMFRRQP